MDNSNRFVMKPKFTNLSEQGLNYKDILTYIAIRSYYNHTDKYCYPSYKALSQLSGLSRKFLSLSVKRLDKSGFIQLWKVGTKRVSHWYLFNAILNYQRIPLTLFAAPITVHEKSILLILSEHCESGSTCYLSITEIAALSGLSYRTIYRQYQALRLKGYILEGMYADPLEETLIKYFKLTDKLKWNLSSKLTIQSNNPTVCDAMTMIAIATKRVKRAVNTI